MARGRSRAPSQRQLRVGEELRHALAAILERRELRDPRLSGIDLTITEVQVSPDLKHATAFVAAMGRDCAGAVVSLGHAAPFLRRRVAESVRLRFVPELRFEADLSFDNAERIDALIRRTHESPGDRGGEGNGDGP